MQYKTLIKSLSRSVITLLTIALIATMAVGQNLAISGGTFSGGGQYFIKGNITNTAPVTINGIVTLEGTAAQAVGTAGNGSVNFQTLNISNSNGNVTASFAVSTTISTALSVANGTTLAIGNNIFRSCDVYLPCPTFVSQASFFFRSLYVGIRCKMKHPRCIRF